MAQTVTITLTTAGTDTGPFDLYSDADGYVTPFETGVLKALLVAGYTSIVVPDGATIIRVVSTGICTNFVDLPIDVVPTTTTTTTTEAPQIVTFDGFFEFCNDVTSTSDFRVQDGSLVPGHFATSPAISPNNCTGTIFVGGTLTSAQGPLVIAVPSVPVGDLATVVSNSIAAVGGNAVVTFDTASGYLKVIITPNTYPSTVQLAGTLTVTYNP